MNLKSQMPKSSITMI